MASAMDQIVLIGESHVASIQSWWDQLAEGKSIANCDLSCKIFTDCPIVMPQFATANGADGFRLHPVVIGDLQSLGIWPFSNFVGTEDCPWLALHVGGHFLVGHTGRPRW